MCMLYTSGCEKEAVGDIFNFGQKFMFADPHVRVQKLVCSWGIVKCCDEERLVVVTVTAQVDSPAILSFSFAIIRCTPSFISSLRRLRWRYLQVLWCCSCLNLRVCSPAAGLMVCRMYSFPFYEATAHPQEEKSVSQTVSLQTWPDRLLTARPLIPRLYSRLCKLQR